MQQRLLPWLEHNKLKHFKIAVARKYRLRFITSANEEKPFTSMWAWQTAYHARPENQTATNIPDSRASDLAGMMHLHYEAIAEQLSCWRRKLPSRLATLRPRKSSSCVARLAGSEEHDMVVMITAIEISIIKMEVRFIVHWSVLKSFEACYQELRCTR